MALMMSNLIPSPARGEIWYINLDPTVGHEQTKTRPCLIISNNKFNRGASDLVIAIPITSKMKSNPLHIPIHPPDGGITMPSFILCDQIRVVSHERIHGACLGKLSPKTIAQVEYAIKILLNIYE